MEHQIAILFPADQKPCAIRGDGKAAGADAAARETGAESQQLHPRPHFDQRGLPVSSDHGKHTWLPGMSHRICGVGAVADTHDGDGVVRVFQKIAPIRVAEVVRHLHEYFHHPPAIVLAVGGIGQRELRRSQGTACFRCFLHSAGLTRDRTLFLRTQVEHEPHRESGDEQPGGGGGGKNASVAFDE